MSEQKEIADVVLDTPEPDRWVDCGESRPLPMFHMHTLMQYGERCAEAALAWLRSQGEPVAVTTQSNINAMRNGAERGIFARDPVFAAMAPRETDVPLYAAPQPAIPDGWQPIETAPKDGTMFLCWVSGERYSGADGECSSYSHDVSQIDFCWWHSGPDEMPEAGYFDPACGQIGDLQDVTHWMPLPAAPEPRK